MDALYETQELDGKVVQSGNKWMIVFPDAGPLRELIKELLAAQYSRGFDKKFKLVEPLSWHHFETLSQNNGLHITLLRKPLVQHVKVKITGSVVWTEETYASGIPPYAETKGFIVLLVNVSPKVPCDEPCHISIAQIVRKSQKDVKQEKLLTESGL